MDPKKINKDVNHHVRWKFEWGCNSFNLVGIGFTINLEEMNEKNGKIFTKNQIHTITMEQEKTDTIRKITVLKTLIIPILNHLFIDLPNPHKDLINLLDTMFFKSIMGE